MFALVARSQPATQRADASFRRDVAPLLLDRCQKCHGAEKAKGDYRLDTFERLMKSGESGEPPVVAGKPRDSKLYQLITTAEDDDRMPKKSEALAASSAAAIRTWIEQGARFDGGDRSAPLSSLVEREYPEPPLAYRQPVAVTALAFNPAGTELAVSGYHEVTLWNPDDGRLIGRIRRTAQRTVGLAYEADGKTLVVAGGEPGKLGELRLCDAAERTSGRVIERAADVLLVVRFSPDGRCLAAGGADNAIRIYDVPSWKRQFLIEQHADWVTDLAYSADGTKIVSASRDKSARVFDAKTGSMTGAFLGHEEPVTGVAWVDEKSVLSAGKDRNLRLWSIADGKQAAQIGGLDAEPLRIEAGFGSLFVAGTDGAVRHYSLGKRDLVSVYPRTNDWVYCIAVDPKHRRIAIGTYGGEVRVWDADAGKLVCEFVAAPGYAGSAR
jgi:WD40 repeat protein